MRSPRLSITFALFLHSCSSDQRPAPDATPDFTQGSLSADIDTTHWTAVLKFASLDLYSLGIGGQDTIDASGWSISLVVYSNPPGSLGTGTFPVDPPGNSFSVNKQHKALWITGEGHGSGSVTITTLTST